MKANYSLNLSTTIWNGILCDYTSLIDLLQTVGVIQEVCSVMLLFIFGFEIFIIPLSLIGFMFLRKWNNPAKIYYFTISINSALACIFEDFSIGFFNFMAVISTYLLPQINIPLFVVFIESRVAIFCPLFYYLSDISVLFEYWTTTIFSIHRMFAVIFPLKTIALQNYFNKWTLLILLALLGALYLPDFLFYYIQSNILCVYFNSGFWYTYLSQLSYVKNIIPLLLITVSITVIILKLARANSTRSYLTRHNSSRTNLVELRTTAILIITSIVYIIILLPYSILFIIEGLTFSKCGSPVFFLFKWISLLVPYLISFQILIRVFDPIIFFLMIPEYRMAILNIICCRCLFT